MSSTDPFKALGLDRGTATEAEVKAAYARLLKATRPEEDRAGFMALRQAFDAARRSARAQDQARAEAARRAEAAAPEDEAPAEAPEAPGPQDVSQPQPNLTWHHDAALGWSFNSSPRGKLVEGAARWMVAGGPDGAAFAARCAEALIALPAPEARAFREDVVNFIAHMADPEEAREDLPVWKPLPVIRPDWLTADVAAILRDDLGLLKFRPSDSWSARNYNAVRGLLAPETAAPDAALPPPADVDAIVEREETEARRDAHGSYYDRAAHRWVDRSPVTVAMEDIAAATQRNMWDLPEALRAIFARDELQALDEFQDFDARLRQMVCAATGWGNEARRPAYPAWLRPQVVQLLDGTFGWSRQFGRQHWQRQQYEWLHKVLSRDVEIGGDMPEFREAAPLPRAQPPSKFSLWEWLLREPRNLLIAYLGYRAVQILWRLVV
ncbi:hypothetical protein [Roseovarius aquimarinus]|uniref:J domain-containing protein n=1 Tax=Roseovarius aquimarinus TaxID=1229156 RepID=A0ABW7I566_9RHOB